MWYEYHIINHHFHTADSSLHRMHLRRPLSFNCAWCQVWQYFPKHHVTPVPEYEQQSMKYHTKYEVSYILYSLVFGRKITHYTQPTESALTESTVVVVVLFIYYMNVSIYFLLNESLETVRCEYYYYIQQYDTYAGVQRAVLSSKKNTETMYSLCVSSK